MGNEIVVSHQAVEQMPVTRGFDDLAQLGEAIVRSKMLGDMNPAGGLVVAMTCFQERITPIEFGRRYHLINNKPSKRADRMLAEFMELGGTVVWGECNDKIAQGQWKYGVNDRKEQYTIEDAERAGLLKKKGDGKSGWDKDPGAMLRARLVSKVIRMICPAVVAGLHTPEEMQEVAESQQQPATPPQAIAKDEQAQRLANAGVSVANADGEIVTPAIEQKPSPFDQPPNFNICPIEDGPFGQEWSTLGDQDLDFASRIVGNAAMMPGHYQAINAEIEKRKGGQQ